MKLAIEFRKKEFSEVDIKDLVTWNTFDNRYCDFEIVKGMKGKNYYIVFDQAYVQHDLNKLYASVMLYLDIKNTEMDLLFITEEKYNSLKEVE